MDIILLGVTAISIVVAVIMAAAARRLNREERVRSEARVAALNAAAGDDAVPAPQPKPVVEAAPTTAPLAVNESRSTPPWATARVSTFATPKARAADAASRSLDGPPRGSDAVIRPAVTGGEFPVEKSPMGDNFLAVSGVARGDDRQKGLAIAAAILLVAALAGGYWTVFGSRARVPTAAAAATAPSPLELVSLRHERRGGRLAVTGLVRNPAAGSPVSKLSAVVFLFDQQGGFISSARTDIDYVSLAPEMKPPC
jgi:hypothetical protein